MIDTAAIYGLGHSEEIVRAALKEIPSANRPYVFTKCGLRWDEHDRMASPQHVATPASIRFELEASLKAGEFKEIAVARRTLESLR